jgi:hypothetical protein
MFELIGILFVCWVVYKVVAIFFRASATVRSQENGREARNISARELVVPEAYHNHLVLSNIEGVKKMAVMLRGGSLNFKDVSWPRLLALVIYGQFHDDCKQWRLGNPIQEQLFIRLGITPEMIAKELDRNATKLMHGSIKHEQMMHGGTLKKMSDSDIKELILWCAEKRSTDIDCPYLSYERINEFVGQCSGEWFPNYRGMRVWFNIDGDEYGLTAFTIDASQKDQSGVTLRAWKETVTND